MAIANLGAISTPTPLPYKKAAVSAGPLIHKGDPLNVWAQLTDGLAKLRAAALTGLLHLFDLTANMKNRKWSGHSAQWTELEAFS